MLNQPHVAGRCNDCLCQRATWEASQSFPARFTTKVAHEMFFINQRSSFLSSPFLTKNPLESSFPAVIYLLRNAHRDDAPVTCLSSSRCGLLSLHHHHHYSAHASAALFIRHTNNLLCSFHPPLPVFILYCNCCERRCQIDMQKDYFRVIPCATCTKETASHPLSLLLFSPPSVTFGPKTP